MVSINSDSLTLQITISVGLGLGRRRVHGTATGESSPISAAAGPPRTGVRQLHQVIVPLVPGQPWSPRGANLDLLQVLVKVVVALLEPLPALARAERNRLVGAQLLRHHSFVEEHHLPLELREASLILQLARPEICNGLRDGNVTVYVTAT